MRAAPDSSQRFGQLLRRHRGAAGLSLAALAGLVHYSKGHLSKVETGLSRGSAELAILCDVVLDTGGELAAAVELEAAAEAASGSASRRGSAGGLDPARLMIEYALRFLVALDSAHKALRDVASGEAGFPSTRAASGRAVQDAGLYAAREHLLASGSPDLVQASELAFRQLIEIRNVVRGGADLESVEYHQTYHAFSHALWSYRMRIRAELGQPVLGPTQLGLADWSDRDRCPSCRLARSAENVRPSGLQRRG